MSEKNDVSMGKAGMISVSEKKVCNNVNSNIDVSAVFSCKVQLVMGKVIK